VKLAVAMQGFWMLRGYSTEGRRLVRAALQMPAVQGFSLAKAHALYVGATLAWCQSDHGEALQMLEVSLAIHRELGDPDNIAATLSMLSAARLESGDAAGARADEVEAIALFRQLGQRLNEVIALCHLGQVALFENDLEQARARLTEGLALAREIESAELEGELELLLGDVELDAGAPLAAGEHFERSLAVCREGANTRGVANAQWRLGGLDLARADYAAARRRLEDALAAFHNAEMWKEVLGCLEDFAALAHLAGLYELAVRIAAVTTLSRQRLGLVRRPAAHARWEARLDLLRQPLGDVAFVAAWNDARDHWEAEDAIRSARALPQATQTVAA